MNRRLLLKSTLRDNFTEQFINRFESFKLELQELENFTSIAKNLLEKLPIEITDSSVVSSILANFIRSQNFAPIVVLTGKLHYEQTCLFSVTKLFPSSNKPLIPSQWKDTHFWLECGGYIIDLTLFRRIYNGEINPTEKEALINRFGFDRGAMIATPENFNKYGFKYIPQCSLSEFQINQLAETLT